MRAFISFLCILVSAYTLNAQQCRTTCKNDVQFVFEAVEVQPGAIRCYSKFTLPCAPYKCANDFACTTSCISSADCSETSVCSASGKCVPNISSCSSAFQVKAATGTLTDCSPYTCLSGQCRSNCVSQVDCSSGSKCIDQKCK